MLQAKALGISSDLGHEDAVPQDGERFSQRCPSRSGCSREKPEFHLRQWVSPSSTRLSLVTPFAAHHLHFIGNRGIQLHLAMAGNYPRIPGITLGLGLVHYPLLPVTHRFALLVQSGGSAPPPRLPATERRTACPSS